MSTLGKDLLHSWRMLAQSPGFAIAAVGALALSIGANTAIFTVVDTVLLKPLGYPDPDRIVAMVNTGPHGEFAAASPVKYNAWLQQTSVLQDVAGYDSGGPGINLTGGAFPEQIQGMHATASYFRLFGTPFVLGRAYSEDEDRPHAANTAVISYGLWQRRYGRDANLVGRPISIGGSLYTVVGVVASQFQTDPPSDIWLPFQIDPNSRNQAHFFQAAGRLKPGVSLQQANAQMQIAADDFKRKYPEQLGPRDSFGVKPVRDVMVTDVRQSLLILTGAVSFVLLIACANIANLLLARATGRKREIAIRAALGAGRLRIVRQLLTESLLLAVCGGAAGLLLGIAGVRALLAMNPGDLPFTGQHGAAVALDWRVLTFTAAISLGSGILFGLAPALGASRTDLIATLKESGGRGGTGLGQGKTRALLVVAETALALVLLIGAALLLRTFVALRTVNPGFDARNVLTMAMSLSGTRFERTEGVTQLIRDGTEQLRAVAGVEAAGTTCCLPLEGGYALPFRLVGRSLPDGQPGGGAGWRTISAGYFAAFRIPVLRGRDFSERDGAGSPKVAIINEAMARKFWGRGRDPLEDQILIGKGMGPAFEEPARQVIGIVGDVRDSGLAREPGPMMFVPAAQVSDGVTAMNAGIGPLEWVIRTRTAAGPLSARLQEALRQGSGGMPVANVRSMEEVVRGSTARNDFNMLLLTLFGCAALLLAAIGIYGLMAYAVGQRTQEIGIRMALGAEAAGVRRMILVQAIKPALAGVAIGVAGALGLTRLLQTALFGVTATDPMVFGVAALVLIAVAVVSAWAPARRATRIDPLEALRYE